VSGSFGSYTGRGKLLFKLYTSSEWNNDWVLFMKNIKSLVSNNDVQSFENSFPLMLSLKLFDNENMHKSPQT
jgi:hypothetical protein